MLTAANADTQTMLNDIIGTVQTLAVVTQMGEITKAIDAAEDLANRVKVVNTPLHLGELSFVATKTDPADLEIKYTEAFDALSGAQRKPVIDASDAKPGTYEFVASPYSPVTLGLGPPRWSTVSPSGRRTRRRPLRTASSASSARTRATTSPASTSAQC